MLDTLLAGRKGTAPHRNSSRPLASGIGQSWLDLPSLPELLNTRSILLKQHRGRRIL
jgi:hypothetical protein